MGELLKACTCPPRSILCKGCVDQIVREATRVRQMEAECCELRARVKKLEAELALASRVIDRMM